jgi:hypothetical protein
MEMDLLGRFDLGLGKNIISFYDDALLLLYGRLESVQHHQFNHSLIIFLLTFQ